MHTVGLNSAIRPGAPGQASPGFSLLTWLVVLISACPIFAAGQDSSLGVIKDTDSVAKYDRIELAVTGMDDYSNPMDPSIVKFYARLKSPSGKTVEVPGFAMHKTEKVLQKNQFKYIPTGRWLYRIRYAPDEMGRYTGRVIAVAGGKAVKSDQFEFEVTEPRSKGMIRVAKNNPHAFEYDDGTGYIAIGQNLCWANGKDRAKVFENWLDNMAEQNCNFIRLWLGSQWCFGIQGSKPYQFSEDALALADEVLEMCEDRGIAVKMCLGNNINRYLKQNDGPYVNCTTKDDFLQKPEAKKQWRALQRYAVARWGASRSVFAWELWNEMDHNFWGKSKQVADWSEEMCKHIQSIDPHNHPTTNSTGSGSKLFYLWNKPHVDFAQYHNYGGKEKQNRASQYELYAPPVKDLRKTGKPVLLAESGLGQQTQKKDVNGYAFHEQIWIGFFAGGIGTGMTWWWDSVIGPLDLYYHMGAFEKFVRDLPVNREPFPPVEAVAEPAKLKCYARAASWGAVAWIVNDENQWQDLMLDGEEAQLVSGAELTIPSLDAGEYLVKYFDTRKGEFISQKYVTLASDDKTIAMPDFKIDVAVKILKAN